MKETFQNLSAKYQQSVELAEQAHKLLVDFLDEALAVCGGVVELTGFHKSYEEADDAGVDFDDQFPVEICITDKHGWNHNIYITRLYKKNSTFYIDGYDYTDGEWIAGWYVTHTDSMYSDLSAFVQAVINPQEPDDNDDTAEVAPKEDAVLVGYQLVDEDDCYPSGFSGWDVFRTIEDAEAYRATCLEPDEYRITQDFATPSQTKHYRYHAQVKRSFTAGETVWVKGLFSSRFVKVLFNEARSFFNLDTIMVTYNDDRHGNINDKVQLGWVYQQVKDSVCPKCGKPLYRGHWSEDDAAPVCIECDKV